MSNEKSKQNGLVTDPLQRLASFKAPRDLTLGGVKPNKKVFTPNLNVARNKNKGLSSTNTRDQKSTEKGRKDRKNDRNRDFKNGPKVIKSSGVFSEGLGAIERHTSRFSYGRDEGSTTVLQKPTIRVKDVIKIDKELEEQKIKSVCGFDDNDESVEDFKQSRDIDAPIKLPMDDGGRLYSKPKPKVPIKQEVIVKKEPEEDDMYPDVLIERMAVPDTKKETLEDTDVVKILKSDKPLLILLQLPDSLPGRGGGMDDDHPRRKLTVPEPSTSSGDNVTDEKQADNRCRLTDLTEGRIGKLRVHRSGRVTLLLGDTAFEVSCGTKAAFHQEVVSVATDDATRSANIVALGPLQHKLNVVPDWEAVFADMSM